jgi:acyl-homoserine-lactone acylase
VSACSSRTIRAILAVVAAAALLPSVAGRSTEAAGKAEVLWDKYGVPHIFAEDREAMFYAEGWAQMHNQANLLLKLYGESRGRGAEYWGPDGLELDRWLQLNGVPERAKEWYDAQSSQFRKYLDAFANGINAYGKAHPESIDARYRIVLPVTGVDVVGHSLRVVHYMYMASMGRVRNEANAYLRNRPAADSPDARNDGVDPLGAIDEAEEARALAGSNTWTIGPPKSASGNAMLLINPHLSWGETFYRYMEVHLVAPDYDLYGAPQVGFPTPVVGFNRHAGWGRTVNTIDTVDFFKLTVKDGQYIFDGTPRAFERQTRTLKIKQPDGTFKTESLEIRRTVHGPVVFDDRGLTLAMRVAGLDRPKMLEQWFRMGEATTLEQFKEALRMQAVPMWNANFADDQGHIMLVDNGLIARRNGHDYAYWNGVVPGDTSETLWNSYLTFDDLPKSIDPAIGWNQNENEPPWLFTFPQLDRTKYPAYVAPTGEAQPQMRVLRALRMLNEDGKISYEQLVAKKHSTRMELADKVLPDLIAAAKAPGAPAMAATAAAALEAWDRNTDVDSRGGVLFQLFVNQYLNQGMAAKMRVKYDPARPLESAYGLADPTAAVAALAAAAEECQRLYGSLDVKWGDVYRFASGKADLPGNGGAGGSGLFRTVAFSRRVGNKYYAANGETIVCAIEFAKTQRANCVLGYGNATQPGSPHLEDQLPLMVQKALHPVWRDKRDVEANLEKRERP